AKPNRSCSTWVMGDSAALIHAINRSCSIFEAKSIDFCVEGEVGLGVNHSASAEPATTLPNMTTASDTQSTTYAGASTAGWLASCRIAPDPTTPANTAHIQEGYRNW